MKTVCFGANSQRMPTIRWGLPAASCQLILLVLLRLRRLLLILLLPLALALSLPLLLLLSLGTADVAPELELALVQSHTLVRAQRLPESMKVFPADVSGCSKSGHSSLGRKLIAAILGRHDAIGFPQFVNVPLFTALLFRLWRWRHNKLRGTGDAHNRRLRDHSTPLLLLLTPEVLLLAAAATTALRGLFLVLLVHVTHRVTD